MQEGGSEGSSETSNLVEIEEYFPTNKQEIISNSIATNDAQTIHDKLEKYEHLDTEERYPPRHAASPSYATYQH